MRPSPEALELRKKPLLPKLAPKIKNKKTLVIDLDETLVHSCFSPIPDPDIMVQVELEGTICNVYVLVRPDAQEFLEKMAELYEIVIFTASLSKYANPLINKLDPKHHTDFRLFRQHCTFHQGMYIKDMERIGRDCKNVILLDNSPISYIF